MLPVERRGDKRNRFLAANRWNNAWSKNLVMLKYEDISSPSNLQRWDNAMWPMNCSAYIVCSKARVELVKGLPHVNAHTIRSTVSMTVRRVSIQTVSQHLVSYETWVRKGNCGSQDSQSHLCSCSVISLDQLFFVVFVQKVEIQLS